MKKNILWLIATLLLTSNVQAQNLEQQLLNKNKQNKTYVAQFVETKSMPKLKKETKKEGTLYFRAPGELAMRYTNPAGDYSIILADGKFITRRGQKKTDIPMNPNHPSPFYTLRNTLLLSMQGDVAGVAKENEATFTIKKEGKNIVCRIEKNKPAKVGVNTLDLIYDEQTGGLLLLRLNEANGNYTEYAASNGKMNADIPEKTWEL